MIKKLSIEAFTVAQPYDWRPADWQLYATAVLGWEEQQHPNASESLQARLELRKN